MGSFISRQNATVEEASQGISNAYKYPSRVGNFFGSHFIMGGERFDTPQPESYLFGENADLNFLGSKPTSFPYPPPQANEPTKTLKSLINIRKESVRFIRVPQEKNLNSDIPIVSSDAELDIDIEDSVRTVVPPACLYNIEFTFDADVKCAITIYYFCTEEISPNGITLIPKDGLTSETYHYEKGINQYFSQQEHMFNPQLIPEDDLNYNVIKEQYPIAIHCVVDDGNEECRQSHTTVCVIDHHLESNSYVLRALKQKIFVDGLCYLLQEIYGIENKAANKSIEEDIDDHGSECVICMSESRDTLILPCRHLCLCNSCADSLRYQANNCPICRAPFRALLQIRAVQKGISTHALHQNTQTSANSEPAACDVPQGYVPVSLIEALNGPTQYVYKTRNIETKGTETFATATVTTNDNKTQSPLKLSNQRRSKNRKNVSTRTSINEDATTNLSSNTGGGNMKEQIMSVVDIENDPKKLLRSPSLPTSPVTPVAVGNNKLLIVNECQNLKLSKQKRGAKSSNKIITTLHESANGTNPGDEEDDSENENLSPLLSVECKNKTSTMHTTKTMKQVVAALSSSDDDCMDMDDNDGAICDNCEDLVLKTKQKCATYKKQKTAGLTALHVSTADTVGVNVSVGSDSTLPVNLNAEDSDYYTPEDTQNSILSPLCPTESLRSSDHVSGNNSGGGNVASSVRNNSCSIGFSNPCNLNKNNLQKKSTSVGNIVNTVSNNGIDTGELKCNNVSSLPDMLDSPISGNSTSTRSSSDSYSSSSSTKQLLNSNPITAMANVIVDDKSSLQNAVNV